MTSSLKEDWCSKCTYSPGNCGCSIDDCIEDAAYAFAEKASLR